MERKVSLVMSAFIMTLVIAQIQVEAKICCRDPTTRAVQSNSRCWWSERYKGWLCPRTRAVQNGCQIISSEGTCPPSYAHEILENSGGIVNEYCKLGCVSSACDAMTTLENSAASGIVNGAVEKCTNACSALCNKGSLAALDNA